MLGDPVYSGSEVSFQSESKCSINSSKHMNLKEKESVCLNAAFFKVCSFRYPTARSRVEVVLQALNYSDRIRSVLPLLYLLSLINAEGQAYETPTEFSHTIFQTLWCCLQ